MSTPHQVVLTHGADVFPEALQAAALAHLARVTGHTPEQLTALLQHLPAVVARVDDAQAAQQLQAELARAGWRAEPRAAPPPPAQGMQEGKGYRWRVPCQATPRTRPRAQKRPGGWPHCAT